MSSDFTFYTSGRTTWMIGRGNIKVGLFLRPDAKPVSDINSEIIIQHVAFLVDGDKFASIQEEIHRKGAKIEGPEDTGIAYSSFFNDPDGHLLEITTYHAIVPPVIPSGSATLPASHTQ